MIPTKAIPIIEKLLKYQLSLEEITENIKNPPLLIPFNLSADHHQCKRTNELYVKLRDMLPPSLLSFSLQRILREFKQCLSGPRNYEEDNQESSDLFLSEEESVGERSFTSVDRSVDEETEFAKNFEDIDENAFNSTCSTQTSPPNFQPKLNQNDAIKFISTHFAADCELKRNRGIKIPLFKDGNQGMEIPKYPQFKSFQAMKSIMETSLLGDTFLWSLVEFLQSEIPKYENHDGLFFRLENHHYLDSTIDRVLRTINDLIILNNMDPYKKEISRMLDPGFLRFEDGSYKSNKRSIFAKHLKGGMELEEEPRNKQPRRKLLPPSNQNDALKLFSSYFQDFSPEKFKKFKFFKDIIENILKDPSFPVFMSSFSEFLNDQIQRFNAKKDGLIKDLISKGYLEKMIIRVLSLFRQLIDINNHIGKCPKCDGFFDKTRRILKMEWPDKWPQQKMPKTLIHDWIVTIEKGECQGFNPKDQEAFKLLSTSRGIRKKK